MDGSVSLVAPRGVVVRLVTNFSDPIPLVVALSRACDVDSLEAVLDNFQITHWLHPWVEFRASQPPAVGEVTAVGTPERHREMHEEEMDGREEGTQEEVSGGKRGAGKSSPRGRDARRERKRGNKVSPPELIAPEKRSREIAPEESSREISPEKSPREALGSSYREGRSGRGGAAGGEERRPAPTVLQ